MYEYKSYRYTETKSAQELSTLGRELTQEEVEAIWEWVARWDEAKSTYDQLSQKAESGYISEAENAKGRAAAETMRDMEQRCLRLGVNPSPIARKVSGSSSPTVDEWLKKAALEREERQRTKQALEQLKKTYGSGAHASDEQELRPAKWPKPLTLKLPSIRGGYYVNGKYQPPSQEELLKIALRTEEELKRKGEYKGPVEIRYFPTDDPNDEGIVVSPSADLPWEAVKEEEQIEHMVEFHPKPRYPTTEELDLAEEEYLRQLIAKSDVDADMLSTTQLRKYQQVARLWIGEMAEKEIPRNLYAGNEVAEYLVAEYIDFD